MNGFYYSYDYWYVILVLPAVLWALAAQWRVKAVFSKYSGVSLRNHLTGEAAAREVLRRNGIYDVQIERVAGSLTDHYDPRTKVIRLSQNVYDSSTVAAVGVAAHEAGHAVQYASGYGPIRLRAALLPVCAVGSNLAGPLVILGLISGFPALAVVGLVGFMLAAFFQLVTLPVEFNASTRAINALQSAHIVNDEEKQGAAKVLRAAAMTYVAALAVALANLFRILMLIQGGRKKR